MLPHSKNDNKRVELPLKKVISENYSEENGKVFYSIEITPKEELEIDFEKFSPLPLFVDLTWIRDVNLTEPLKDAPALKFAEKIKSTHVVNSITCYKLTCDHIKEILSDTKTVRNFAVLRGDLVAENQKFKYASELINEIRKQSKESEESVTIFAGGYPEMHIESKNSSEDLWNLKRKVEAGVDIILTQVVFSADKFLDFLRKCREIGISSKVFIIPGLYIPFNWNELQTVLRITKVTMDKEIYEKFLSLKDNDEGFKKFSLEFMKAMIRNIQHRSTEFICGFHFFTMNNFEMFQKIIQIVDFS